MRVRVRHPPPPKESANAAAAKYYRQLLRMKRRSSLVQEMKSKGLQVILMISVVDPKIVFFPNPE
jgi:hypothetical protein